MRRGITIAAATLILVSPLITSAATLSDLQAQLKALLAQIAALQHQTSAPLCVDLSRNLTLGSTGADVSDLQNFLAAKSYLTAVARGYYGFLTAKAVGELQVDLGIVSSADDSAYGIMGPKTRAAIACNGNPPPPKRPGATFTATPTSGWAPLAVSFSNMVGGPLQGSLVIRYGDGSSDTATRCVGGNAAVADTCTTPGTNAHTYTSTGTYTAQLINVRCIGTNCETVLGTATITVGGTPPSTTAPTALHPTIVAQPVIRVDCANSLCAWEPSVAGSYAYAPADITYQGVNHLFFCSTGVPNITADSVRYINDRDAALKVALNPTGGFDSVNKSDIAACDPEVVFFKGYFYLFYGSTRAVDPALYPTPSGGADGLINVIHVARSASIDGPYQILDQGGTWKTTTNTPKHIIPPHVLSTSRSQGQGYLGASWPSVVVRGDTLYLWYLDNTADLITGYAKERYYFLKSTDASVWNTANESLTDIRDYVHSGEVKYDPTSNQFVMFSGTPHIASSWLGVRSSADGIHWSQVAKVTDLPNYSHNVGIESDELGNLPSRPFRFNFAAAPGLVNSSSWGRWDLFAGRLTLSTPPTPSAPTATLTANGESDITINPRETVTYAWSSTNGVSAKGTFTTDTPACDVGAGPISWEFGNTLSESAVYVPGACSNGHTYTFTYTVTASNGQTATATLTVRVRAVPSGPVLGTIDRINQDYTGYSVYGWACAAGNPSPINVHLYLDGPVGGGGTFVGSYMANQESEPQVAASCGSTGATYRYSIPLSTSLIQKYASKTIYVYGISPTGGDNPELPQSGMFTVPTP